MLTRQHPSVLRNPVIADVFHRAGLIEQWGRGTNRVVDMCREARIAPPVFEEIGPFAVVTFRVRVGATAQVTPQVAPQVTPQVWRVYDNSGAAPPRLVAAGRGDVVTRVSNREAWERLRAKAR